MMPHGVHREGLDSNCVPEQLQLQNLNMEIRPDGCIIDWLDRNCRAGGTDPELVHFEDLHRTNKLGNSRDR